MDSLRVLNIQASNAENNQESMEERIQRYKTYIKELWEELKNCDEYTLTNQYKFEELMSYKYYLADLKNQQTM